MNSNTVNSSPHLYRSDIDGLRAVAVILVIFYHAFPHALTGGFIGVDIFFVISGFLITSIIHENLNSNHFSFINFYARRLRRLAPALVLILIFSLSIGFIFLQNDEFNQLKKHILGGVTFTSNIMFWNEAGYFDNAADTKPLLHLWSLAIEEQFYLIWPFLIFLFFKFKRLDYIFFISLIITLSFFINLVLSYNSPVAAFFSLESRFWEFLIGASISIPPFNQKRSTSKLSLSIANAQSATGCILILIGVVLISNHSIFPGWWALLPTIGTILIISAGSNSYINKNLLSNKKLVYIGLLSYPLYIWHWPLLSFARIFLSEVPPPSVRLGLLAIAFLFAALTYHYVERPIRFNKSTKHITFSLLFTLLLVGVATSWPNPQHSPLSNNLTPSSKNEFEAYYLPTEGIQTLGRFENKFRHECNFYQVDKFYEGKSTTIPKDSIDKSCYQPDGLSKHSVLIWGDSHAQMLNYGLRKNLPNDWQILQIASSGCHPSINFTQDSNKDYCARSNWFALNVIRDNKIKTVIVAQSVEHDAANMNKIASKLESLGVEKVIFMGSSPRWTDYLPRILLRQLWPELPERTFVGVDREVINKNIVLKRNFNYSKKQTFIDVIGLFCNEQGCLTRIGKDKNNDLTSWDLGHLTQTASDFLAKKILAEVVMGYSM
jgi:peptidoglycan/LPS O-acetylase OafA/YrhL